MCSFAKGDYKGHTYYVWYAQDIPLKFGPWKLQGLPGLIVEAKDDRNTISFQLLTFETNKGIVVNTPSPTKKFITEKKLKEIQKSFLENPRPLPPFACRFQESAWQTHHQSSVRTLHWRKRRISRKGCAGN